MISVGNYYYKNEVTNVTNNNSYEMPKEEDAGVLQAANLSAIALKTSETSLSFDTLLNSNKKVELLNNDKFYFKEKGHYDFRVIINLNATLSQELNSWIIYSYDDKTYLPLPNTLKSKTFSGKDSYVMYNMMLNIDKPVYVKVITKNSTALNLAILQVTTSLGALKVPGCVVNIKNM